MVRSSLAITKRRSKCGRRSAPRSNEARFAMPAHCAGSLSSCAGQLQAVGKSGTWAFQEKYCEALMQTNVLVYAPDTTDLKRVAFFILVSGDFIPAEVFTSCLKECGALAGWHNAPRYIESH